MIDFSVNINPYGTPRSIIERWRNFYDIIHDYPDPKSLSLRQAIAEKENVPIETVFVGNGAAEVIHLLANTLLEKQKVIIVEPTFSEYGKACAKVDSSVISHIVTEANGWKLKADELIEQLEGVKGIFICNPNNPTGTVHEKQELLKLIKACHERHVLVFIDEAFVDFAVEDVSMKSHRATYPNVIILRSLTKMYAIAGLRLGYCLADKSIVQRLEQAQVEWSVNALAQQIGELCLKDEAFVTDTKMKIATERMRLFPLLRECGFRISDSRVNYYLMKHESISSEEWLTYFLKKGIVARHTMNFRGLKGDYLRFSIRTKEENDRLLDVIQERCSS